MIDPTMPEPPVELSDVLADDELISRLSRRAARPDEEPLARLLASWAAQVDAETDRDLAAGLGQVGEPGSVPVPALAAVASHRRTRRIARGSRLAVVVTAVGVGLGSLTGVAAAVTGDPLAPYRPVISGVLGVDGGEPSSPQPGAADSGATGDEAGTRASATDRHEQQRSSAKDDRPGAAASQAAQATQATDGWRAHWPGLPPQAVGPAERPGLDGTTPGGGAGVQDGDRPGSTRADQVRGDRGTDWSTDRGSGAGVRDEGAGAAVPQRGGGADAEQGSGADDGLSTPPGHQLPRR